MENEMMNKICRKVYEQFPFVEGILPDIRPQPNDTKLLIFQASGKASNQKAIPIHVRVLIDKMGEILKITSSR